jgi:hypothetical protein
MRSQTFTEQRFKRRLSTFAVRIAGATRVAPFDRAIHRRLHKQTFVNAYNESFATGAFRWPTRNERITNEYDNYDNPKDPKTKRDHGGIFKGRGLITWSDFRSSLEWSLAG